MRIGYYPGCSLHATSREFDESLQAVSRALDVELAEIDDWSCCGATSAHATNHLLSVALPARNLALAEEQGHDAVLAPCAACFNRLASARHEARHDAALAVRLAELLGHPFTASVEVRNVVDLLRELAPAIKAKATAALSGVRVACYYGCLLVRPAEVCAFDDPEQPSAMEQVVRACGADPVAWNLRLECCGGAFSLARTASVVRLGRAIIADARRAGAAAVVVACPMCHSNLDFRQAAMHRRGEKEMPILFITELVGLALGLDARALGLQRHFTTAALPSPSPAPAGSPPGARAAGRQASPKDVA
jgi:heterodisulfide reductase subunit B